MATRLAVRTVVLGFLSALSTVSTSAPAAAGIRPGVEAGVAVVGLRYNEELPVWETGTRLAYSGGVTLDMSLGKRLALISGLRLLQQGNRVEYDTGPGSGRQVGEFRVVQNYLSMPFLLRARPTPSTKFFVQIGPEIAVLLSARLIVEETVFNGSAGTKRTEYADIRDALESMNASARVGTGVELPLENHAIVLSLNYSHGLAGVAKEQAWFSNWKTQSVEGGVGLRW